MEELVDVGGFEHWFAINDETRHSSVAIHLQQFLRVSAVGQGIFHHNVIMDSQLVNGA